MRAAMDGSKSVAIKDAPLVFLGYGVKAPERKWDDFKGVDLHGKIGIVLINDPDFETGSGDFGGKAMTYYGRWTYKYEEAARQGALGLLIVHETEPASYGWKTVKNSNTNTQFDIVRDKPRSVHPKVEAWIQRDFAVDLFKQRGLDFEALKKQAQTRDFKPVVLKGVTFSADYAVDTSVITSHNVVGRVEGSKRPDETVIYSAHWDHLGVGAPDAKGDTIYNGAVDNATGTAALIELGRAFAHAPKPERSVVFLNVTAEEKGLLGSEYYASKPLYPLAKTVAVHQHGRARSDGSGAQLHDVGQREIGSAGPADRRCEERGPRVLARSASRSGPFLPLRSLLVRQAGRAGAFVRIRQRSRQRRRRGRRGRAQGLRHQPLPPARRRMAGDVDVRRHGARSRRALSGRRRPCELGPLAGLVAGFGIPRQARRNGRRAPLTVSTAALHCDPSPGSQ